MIHSVVGEEGQRETGQNCQVVREHKVQNWAEYRTLRDTVEQDASMLTLKVRSLRYDRLRRSMEEGIGNGRV